jgi:predicted RNA-binding Zn ribbon-like protein
MTRGTQAADLRRVGPSGFRFVGRLCVDLAVSGGEGKYAVFETLFEPGDLDRWLAKSSLRVKGVRASEGDLGEAKRLRAGIWEAIEAVIGSRALPRGAVREINRAATRPALVRRLEPDGSRSWHSPTATAALAEIARDAIEMLTDPHQRDRVRECAAPDCVTVFYDDSRPGRRRWCSDKVCGDRNRARAYRARRATASTG